MTTNKPEVVAWLHSVRQDSDVITDKVRHVWGTPLGSMGEYTVPLIRLSDYEALQAKSYESGRRVGLLEAYAGVMQLIRCHCHGDGATGLLTRAQKLADRLAADADAAIRVTPNSGGEE